MALNIGSNGEALRDCLTNLEPDFLDRAVQTALDNPHIVRLIAVNLSERSLGSADPKAILRAAHKAAEITGLSLMLAMAPDHVMSIDAQLETLRPGDIVTYCYRSQPWCLFPEEGPRQTIIDALARGVLLDIAHGSEAFDPEVARRAVALGLLPSAVSSGLKISESGHPKPLSLPNVMQRMHVAGMLLDDILRGVTTIPSKILGFTDGTGSFVVGGRADLTMLDLESATWSAKQLLVAGQTLR
jgi:dihydroorotase